MDSNLEIICFVRIGPNPFKKLSAISTLIAFQILFISSLLEFNDNLMFFHAQMAF